MAASRRNVASAFLHRAFLLAGVLAVLAGILGMHVLTGSHSMHSTAGLTAAVGAATVHTASAAGHDHPGLGAGEASSPHGTGVHLAASSSLEDCSCSDSCTGMHTMTVSCTPSANTGSLSVPLPGIAVFGIVPDAKVPGTVPGSYSYLPGSPSPGQLSISRT